jgi:hypothetical protein
MSECLMTIMSAQECHRTGETCQLSQESVRNHVLKAHGACVSLCVLHKRDSERERQRERGRASEPSRE